MSDIVKFGTVDRYFSDKNEKRIGRVSFFLRMLFIIIMVALFSIAINMWLFNIVQLNVFYIMPIVIMLGLVFLIFSVPVLAKKRSHDFDSDGKIISYTFYATLILKFLLNLYILYVLFTGSFLDLLRPNIVVNIFEYIATGLGLASLVIMLLLILRPGNPGENKYGALI